VPPGVPDSNTLSKDMKVFGISHDFVPCSSKHCLDTAGIASLLSRKLACYNFKLCRPFDAEKLCLLQHKFRCFVLEIGRIAVFAVNAFDQHFDIGASAFSEGPVNGDAFVNLSHQFGIDLL